MKHAVIREQYFDAIHIDNTKGIQCVVGTAKYCIFYESVDLQYSILSLSQDLLINYDDHKCSQFKQYIKTYVALVKNILKNITVINVDLSDASMIKVYYDGLKFSKTLQLRKISKHSECLKFNLRCITNLKQLI